MAITATELKNNLGKYLELAETEEVYITKNGRLIAKLAPPNQDRLLIAESLLGSLPSDISLVEAREERLAQK